MTTTTPQAMAAPKRYHPVQVALHWLIAIFVIITPLLASEGEGRQQAPAIGGVPIIGIHMILGITILVLLLIRLVIRLRVKNPNWATTGSSLLDRVGQWTHIALYFFTFAVTITGLIFALQTNRLQTTFGGAPQQSGPGFGQGQFQPGQPPQPGIRPGGEGGEGGEGGFQGGVRAVGRFIFRAFHELSWQILLLLIILHVAAALYHQFIRRDHLLNRMWFGRAT
jgi:cytochrome b561